MDASVPFKSNEKKHNLRRVKAAASRHSNVRRIKGVKHLFRVLTCLFCFFFSSVAQGKKMLFHTRNTVNKGCDAVIKAPVLIFFSRF